jgi:preprotein translocase subunit YajC
MNIEAIAGKELEMDNLFVLAQAESNQAPSRIGSEPIKGGPPTADSTSLRTGQSTAVVQDPNGGAAQPTSQRPTYWPQLIWLLLLFVVMYMLFLRAPRKREQQHKRMVQSLEKNDKVRTVGGIIGIVVEVKGDEVVLKVDESNNTKIRVSVSAIGSNLTKEGK